MDNQYWRAFACSCILDWTAGSIYNLAIKASLVILCLFDISRMKLGRLKATSSAITKTKIDTVIKIPIMILFLVIFFSRCFS